MAVIRRLSVLRISWRHVFLSGLIVAGSVAGCVAVRQVAARNAEREGGQRAAVAALEVQNALDRGAGYTDTLRRYLVHQPDVGNQAWARYVRDSLAGFGLTEGGWIEQVSDEQRPA